LYSTSQHRSSTTDCATCHQPVGYHQWRVSVGPHLTFHYPECARCVFCSEPVRSGSLVTIHSTGVVCIGHHPSTADTYALSLQEVNKLDQNDFSCGSSTERTFDLKTLSTNAGKLELAHRHFFQNCLHIPILIDHSANTVTSTAAHGRLRTVINKRQLAALRTCYSINARPDSLTKQRLAQMTGLSPRVIRVWFQNKRCLDKKRRLRLPPNSTPFNEIDSNSNED
ncbi:hypothetical protein P879_00476, partial [Paragonimus westermani]